MQIHLRQREIEAALKMYVAQQGINLTNKTIEVVFTSGRKDNGLSAELTIEDDTTKLEVTDTPSPLAPITKENVNLVLEETPPKASLFG